MLHAASQDLACLREVGLDPDRIFDTELAARLLGMPRVGLASVVEELLDIKLAKEHSAADWSTRPLPQSWLKYAALDVELLVDVRDRLVERLAETGKADLAAEEFEAVLHKRGEAARCRAVATPLRHPRRCATPATSRSRASCGSPATRVRRNSTSHRGAWCPTPRSSPSAKALPRTRRALADLREFTGRASRSELDRWWSAIERGLATDQLPAVRVPSDSPPPPRAWSMRNPEADARLRLARAGIVEVAEQMDMPVENLLTPDHLRRVAWNPPAEPTEEAIGSALAALGARPWQVAATAQIIADAFVEASQSVQDAAMGGS